MKKAAQFKSVFFVAFLFFTWGVKGQERPLEIKVSLQLKDQTIEDIIKELDKVAGANFSYSTNYFPADKLDIEVYDKTIKEVLSLIFTNTDLNYKLVVSSDTSTS